MDFKWRKATKAQLYEIAYNDQGCNPIYKHQALLEINRRNNRRISGKPLNKGQAR